MELRDIFVIIQWGYTFGKKDMHTYFMEVQCVILVRPRLHTISVTFAVGADLDHVPERMLVRFLLQPLITECKAH